MKYPVDNYKNTPRRIFDKHVDQMEIKRKRQVEDHRADMFALLKRIENLENQLTELSDHQDDHCHDLDLLAEKVEVSRKHGREGL